MMYQMNLFQESEEDNIKKIANKIVEVLNQLDTRWKGTFYFAWELWDPHHDGGKKTALQITIHSEYGDYEKYALVTNRKNLTDLKQEQSILYETLEGLLAPLTAPTEVVAIRPTPTSIFIFIHDYHKVEQKVMEELLC